MKYQVTLEEKDSVGNALGGIYEFNFEPLEEPNYNNEFMDKLQVLACAELILPGDIKCIVQVPEPGEPGYRDPNTLDMFWEAK